MRFDQMQFAIPGLPVGIVYFSVSELEACAIKIQFSVLPGRLYVNTNQYSSQPRYYDDNDDDDDNDDSRQTAEATQNGANI